MQQRSARTPPLRQASGGGESLGVPGHARVRPPSFDWVSGDTPAASCERMPSTAQRRRRTRGAERPVRAPTSTPTASRNAATEETMQAANKQCQIYAVFLAVLVGVALSGARGASAVTCGLGLYDAGSDECRITGAVTAAGSFSFDRTLHILGSGSITVSPAATGLTLNISNDRSLVMDIGAKIVGDVGLA